MAGWNEVEGARIWTGVEGTRIWTGRWEKSKTETKVRRWIERERRGTEEEERHRRRDVLEQSVTIKFSEKMRGVDEAFALGGRG